MLDWIEGKRMERHLAPTQNEEPISVRGLTLQQQVGFLQVLERQSNLNWLRSYQIEDRLITIPHPQIKSRGETMDDAEYPRLLELANKARESAWAVQELKVEHLLVVIKEFQENTNPFNPNSYENLIVSMGVTLLAKNPSWKIQDNVLTILANLAYNRHTLEIDQLKEAKNYWGKQYDDRSWQDFPETYPPGDQFSKLMYTLEHAATSTYGTTGPLRNLTRRAISLSADEIRELAFSRIPENYTINRRYIEKMLQLCREGVYPEWTGERFIHQLKKHVFKPYSNSEFTLMSFMRRVQAEKIAGIIFSDFPVVAVGITGSLARPDFFGFHPSESDIDLLTYFSPKDDRLVNQVIERTHQLSEEVGVPIGPGGTFGDSLMEGSITVWHYANPKNIHDYKSEVESADDVTFPPLIFLAANQQHGTILNVRDSHRFDFESEMYKPLDAFYKRTVLPLQEETKKLFGQLDKDC